MGHLARKKSATKIENVLRRARIFSDFYKVVMPFNRYFTGEQWLHVRGGIRVLVRDVRSMDLNAVMDVIGDDEYHLERLNLPEDAVIVDLGANIGTFCIMARRAAPRARIFAYEPYPATFEILKENAPDGIELFPIAAAGADGSVRFNEGKDYLGMKVAAGGSIEVPAFSLNRILAPLSHIDLLKIDIEGSEYEVLNNAGTETLAKVDRIIMETHDVPGFDDKEWAENLLRRHGFEVGWLAPGIVEAQRTSFTATREKA